MRTVFKVLIFILFVAQGYSQTNNTPANEINKEVWKPFKHSFNTRDWKTYNALHTQDVVRINSYGIRVGEAYKNAIKEAYKKPSTTKRQIDFSFEQRIYTDTIGYEVGYYRIIYTQKDKESRATYGKFHVVLKKQNGQWLIAQDWDTGKINGSPITQKQFNSGELLIGQ